MSTVNRTDASAKILNRPLSSIEECESCVALQEHVWGYDPADVLPKRFFVVVVHTGGQLFGAFNAKGKMVGFLCAMAARKEDGLPYLHSQMLAVLPDCRNLGVGKRLKLTQREDALRRGYSLIEWTFDPLELKNAFFNIEKLGTVIRRYVPNLYGYSSSRLQAGLPSDRLMAEWWLRSSRVCAILDGTEGEELHRNDEMGYAKVEIPTDIAERKSTDLKGAISIQVDVRNSFLRLLSQGYSAVRFHRGTERCSYLFSKNFNVQG